MDSLLSDVGANVARAAVVPNPTDLDTYWVQSQRAPTAAVGPITINATAPYVRDHMIAWEVRAP
jgi:hypothetical protein